jgi:Zn-dependent protease
VSRLGAARVILCNPLTDLNFGALFISLLVLLFSLTVHEMAHAWTADRLGDPTARLLGRISLNPAVHVDPIGTLLLPLLAFATGAPLIGWAKPVPVNINKLRRLRRDYLLVAAAGPASNVVLALVASLLLRVLPFGPTAIGGVDVGSPVYAILALSLQVNVLLAIFNMIPVPPLDGGNVLWSLLPDPAADRFDDLRPYGFIVLYGLLLTGALSAVMSGPYGLILSFLWPA